MCSSVIFGLKYKKMIYFFPYKVNLFSARCSKGFFSFKSNNFTRLCLDADHSLLLFLVTWYTYLINSLKSSRFFIWFFHIFVFCCSIPTTEEKRKREKSQTKISWGGGLPWGSKWGVWETDVSTEGTVAWHRVPGVPVKVVTDLRRWAAALYCRQRLYCCVKSACLWKKRWRVSSGCVVTTFSFFSSGESSLAKEISGWGTSKSACLLKELPGQAAEKAHPTLLERKRTQRWKGGGVWVGRETARLLHKSRGRSRWSYFLWDYHLLSPDRADVLK